MVYVSFNRRFLPSILGHMPNGENTMAPSVISTNDVLDLVPDRCLSVMSVTVEFSLLVRPLGRC